jgi:maleate isomerase
MYGWRGRIGLLVPSVNSVAEPEMALMAPPGVAVFSSRVPLQDSHELAGVADLVANGATAARELSAAGVGVMAFACTTASFYQGVEGEGELQAELEAAAGVPVVTAMGAVVEALTALGAHRVALATPYSERSNALAEAFLGAAGHEVVASRGLAITDTRLSAFASDELAYGLARSLDLRDADALFVSCTNLPTIASIGRLEEDTGLPVVTSNQAMAWACLERLGVGNLPREYGHLMAISSPHRGRAAHVGMRVALELFNLSTAQTGIRATAFHQG